MQEVLQTGSQDKIHNADISTVTLHFACDKHSKETHPYKPIITSTPIPLCTPYVCYTWTSDIFSGETLTCDKRQKCLRTYLTTIYTEHLFTIV